MRRADAVPESNTFEYSRLLRNSSTVRCIISTIEFNYGTYR